MFNSDSFEEIKVLKQNDRQKTTLLEDSDGKKILKRELNGDKREIYKLLQKINHPNLPEIYDVEFDDKTIVFEEYVEAEPLNAIIEKGILKKKHILLIAKQVLLALEELHGQKIIHRDVKPDNILIDENNHIWLVDFDIARIYRNEVRKDTETMGTFGYAPIEQFGMLPTDFTTDIYAFGVTLKTLLDYSGIKGNLQRVAKKCKRLDPAQRYKSAAAVRRAIFWDFQKIAAVVMALALVTISVVSIINTIENTPAIVEKSNIEEAQSEQKPSKKEKATEKSQITKQKTSSEADEKTSNGQKTKSSDEKETDDKGTKSSDEKTREEDKENSEEETSEDNEKTDNFDGDFAGFDYGPTEVKYSKHSTYGFSCIFSTDTPYDHVMFLDDMNKKGKVRFGKENSVINADITLNNGTLSVKLNDGAGKTFNRQFKYEGNYSYNNEYYGYDLRKNADIMCYDLDDDGSKELLIGLNEGIIGDDLGFFYNYVNYCIAWCIRYDKNTGFTLCEGDMFSKAREFDINSFSQKLNVCWERFGDVTGYYLEGNKIIEAY